MKTFFIILKLILIVVLSKIIYKIFLFKILPLIFIQILIGILLTYNKFNLNLNLNPELFLILFIPPILFFDGININIKDFFDNFIEILLLSIILVFFTTLISGFFIYIIVPELSLTESFILASVLSSTDPISLSGFNKKCNLRNKIITILQGESLINDATSLTLLRCIIYISTGFMIFSLNNLIKEFLKIIFGGIFIGIFTVIIYINFIKFIYKFKIYDETVQIILLLVLPFISYLIAENFNVSGILSSVISGITINKLKILNDDIFNIKIQNIWKTLEFLLNGIIFIILGFQLSIITKSILYNNIKYNYNLYYLIFEIVSIYLILIISRFILIYIIKKLSIKYIKKNNFLFSDFNLFEILILSILGVKGSITLAAILALPIILENKIIFFKNKMIFLSSSIILLSLIIGTIILPILVKIFIKKNFNNLNKNNKFLSK